jgi:hypothetical protein
MRRMIRQSICCHPFLCLPFIPRRRSPLEQREPSPTKNNRPEILPGLLNREGSNWHT